MTATYFLINSVLAAVVIGCHSRRSPIAFWKEHFVGLIPTYAAGASVSLLLVVALRQVHFSAILLIPPLLLVTYLTVRSSFGRLEDAKRHVEKLNRMYLSTVETLATAIDAKDEVTHGHIRRVQAAAVGLAHEIGITDEETLKAIEAGALLHDTGKIAVPEHILNKPGKLTPAEFEKMKLHAPIGAEILAVDRLSLSRCPDRAPPPRELGRHGLPRQDPGRRHPHWRPHPVGRGLLRCVDLGPARTDRA